MKQKHLPSLDELRQLVALEATSPTWLTWVSTGEPAGAVQRRGYARLRIGRHGTYACHRIVWSLANDKLIEPELEIDHINGDRSDNNPDNLRACTRAENSQNNLGVTGKTISGLRGVWARPSRPLHPWRAVICINYKQVCLGSFKTKEEAHAAYLAAKREHHQFNPHPRDLAGESL